MMDPAVRKVHMQNLEQYVLDENKIVTCKWLGNNLSLHINVAKNLMQEFLVNQRSKRQDVGLAITYYVSGVTKEEKAIASTIVNESDLIGFKESLKSVLSEHIYSIQKTNIETDLNALFLAGQCDEFCLGAIKSDSTCKRSRDELSSLRLGAYPGSVAPNGNSFQKSNPPHKETIVVKKEFVKEETNRESNENGSNNKLPTVKISDSKKKDVTVSKGKNSIAGFFSKQSSSPKIVKTVQKTEPDCNRKSESKNVISFPKVVKPVGNGIDEIKLSVKDKQKSAEVNSEIKTDSKSKKVNGKKKSSKSTKEAPKKRKRIQCFDSDSEKESGSDDDIFESESSEPVKTPPLSDDEDIIPATPEVIKPIASKLTLNSRKRKKLVDKMYMKDDGYILTVKEEVYESCSDEETVEEPKNSTVVKTSPLKVENNENKKPNNTVETKSNAKKKSSPQGQPKQSSLMSFFTKK